ncbi:MAG: phosphoesterase [Acidimicrobiaceae bacterium]|nr:phosphoesterase [Acidimicrobiaceae bacterium]
MTERHRLLVALLLEGDEAVEVQGLRRALGDRPPWRVPPHVTLVAPRNVRDEELPGVLADLEALARSSRAFHAELGPVATFAPRRPVVYLEVSDDDGAITRLHLEASRAALAPPPGREERSFVPHVTLSNGVGGTEVEAVLATLARYRRTCTFGRVHLLEQQSDAPDRPWQVIASPLLGGRSVVGRGGREIELTVADRLDPAVSAWAAEAWTGYARDTYGPGWEPDVPWAVVAREQGRILGVSTGEARGATCECERLIVDKSARGEGVGSRLLRHVERLAAERGCTRVRLRTLDGGSAERFYAERGYARSVILPAWREGRDFVVMVRDV